MNGDTRNKDDKSKVLTRREFLENSAKTAAGLALGMSIPAFLAGCTREDIEEVFRKHFKELSPADLKKVIARLEKENREKYGKSGTISTAPAMQGVEFAYGLDISRCIGCRRCVHACVKENNQSRDPAIQWIKVLEFKKESGIDFPEAEPYYCASAGDQKGGAASLKLNAEQQRILNDPNSQYPLYDVNQVKPPGNKPGNAEEPGCKVPRADHFYVPVQCQQCKNPPCVKVCPVKATWQEPDGIVVIDYNWCIGCRYCMAACPYGARHFNWSEPNLPAEELNPDMHYLGNRPRRRGVVEKCTFCIQRTRNGRYPACVEICPVGARKFGNLLDPESEIRYIMEHKRVLILKNELATHPKFYYFYGI